MSTLSHELECYLTLRRSLGYHLGTTERILRNFITFADREEAPYLSTALFLRWRETFGHANQQTWARRLGMVRLFTQWLHCREPQHEVPPRALIPSHYRRPRPYIYSEEEIRRIVETTAALPSPNGVRALSSATLFGLIAVTGLRISEALSLDVADVDLDTGVLTLRHGKLGKERVLPVADTTRAQLGAYLRERDRLLGTSPAPFFVSDWGTRLSEWSARYNFATVCQSLGLRPAQKFHRYGRGLRIHDLRHTFAVRTLLHWYRTRQDPTREMLKLMTYLGHTHSFETYWYIEAIPELLALAAQRAEEGHP
jgi:integrase